MNSMQHGKGASGHIETNLQIMLFALCVKRMKTEGAHSVHNKNAFHILTLFELYTPICTLWKGRVSWLCLLPIGCLRKWNLIAVSVVTFRGHNEGLFTKFKVRQEIGNVFLIPVSICSAAHFAYSVAVCHSLYSCWVFQLHWLNALN